jgi:hypothetical protein
MWFNVEDRRGRTVFNVDGDDWAVVFTADGAFIRVRP